MTDRPEVPAVAGSDEGLVAVGRVGRPRGVRGEVFVEPWTDDPQLRFAPGAVLRVGGLGPEVLTVASSSQASGRQVVHFDRVDSREAAEELRGTQLFVPAGERRPLEDPDEFYDTDLVGVRATTLAGRELGPVQDVVHAGSAAYLVVRLDGRDRLIPFVSAIVPTVDLAAGVVVVDPPDGLLEL